VTSEETFEMLAQRFTEEEMDAVLTHLVHPAMQTAYVETTRQFLALVDTEIRSLGVQAGDYNTGYVAGLGRAIQLYPTPT
jgi:uncharacterized protein YcgI (DUF1989 family)